MKNRKNKIRWKISDEVICWIATIIIVALLIVILSACKSHKESTVDYEITSSEAYQERRLEEHEKQMAINKAERHDTLKETSISSGQIEIERDTAGRPLRIIYDHVFNGVQTQGIIRVDTVFEKQVTIIYDTVGTGKKDSFVKGSTKEEKDIGFRLLGLGMTSFFVFLALIILFILVRKWKR